MNKLVVALLLTFFACEALLRAESDNYWQSFATEVLATKAVLSKTDPLESFVGEQMQKIGIPLHGKAENVEKYFGLKFKKHYNKEFDSYYLCIDSDGFYIIIYADNEDGVIGNAFYASIQLYRQLKLSCHKKKVLDISQTLLNKPSQAIKDRLKGLKFVERDYINSIYLPSYPIVEYEKNDYFTHETDNKLRIVRYLYFTFSASPLGMVDGYYMLMGFEWASPR